MTFYGLPIRGSMKHILVASIFLATSLFSSLSYSVEAIKDPLQVELPQPSIELKANAEQTLQLNLSLPEGYYAYYDSFKFKVLEPKSGIEVKKFKFSPLLEFYDKFSRQHKRGIKESAELSLELSVKKVPQVFNLQITYQACSAEFCLLPTNKVINIPMMGAAPVQKITLAESFSDISVEDLISQGSILAFLFIFFAGILTSFTPCIFPMIPITLSILGSQTIGKSRWKGFVISLIYVHGIATTYSLLGLAAAKTGTLFGSYLSSPYVVTAIALLFIAMALSMFGLYEVQIPVFIRTKLGNKKISQGYVGAYISGLIAGIVASPCVGPVLVALLTYVAQTQRTILGFFLLFTYAMGLGLIFILLGTFSQLLSKLPKSGPWMLKVKKAFGVILILMGFYYVWPVFKPYLTPPSTESTTQFTGWTKYSEEVLNEALHKKPVIIDFYADWCAACKELEKFTFTNLEVKHAMENALLLKVDATTENEHITPILEKYGVIGLPTIIFIERDGTVRKDLTLTGFEPPLDFIKRLNKLNSLKD